MNRSVWSNICLDGCTAGHLSSFQPVPMLSGASVTLQERKTIKMLPQRAYYSSRDAGSSLICSSQLELSPSRNTEHSSTRRHQSPASSSCNYHDWNLKSGRHAKRARVESIIKGMSSPPVMHCTDLKTNLYKESDDTQDNERIQGSPLYEDRRVFVSTDPRQTTRQHLESQHQHLRECETRLNLVDAVTNPTDRSDDEKYPTWNDSPETPPKDTFADSYHELENSASRKHQGWKKVKVMNYVQSKPERIKLMADVLKFELSRAVSRSVDSIFKSMSFLQTLPNDGSVETGMPLQSPVCKDNKSKIVSGVQTEALSLVIQKPQLERADENILQSKSRDHHHPKPTVPLNHESALHEEELPDKNHNTAWQHACRRLQDAYSVAGHEMCHAHWNSVKVRTKVNSRSVRSPKTRAVSADPMILPSLYLPHVKIESDSLVNNNLCMLNEGLTTNHLKKAKLMFFYTRYPSSLVLKLCFQDVKFTRCITSQLIKWFSNFREFFYIQMEKFARHAFIEGMADVRRLTVGRESELFRALNMHFNKANDFQVPDRFLEVAEITLREFYIAISVGKDRDPSWKKAIYKVICKLDSDVPAELKNYHSG